MTSAEAFEAYVRPFFEAIDARAALIAPAWEEALRLAISLDRTTEKRD